MDELLRIVECVPDVAVKGLGESYTYLLPDSMEVESGDALLVPFGNRVVLAYAVEAKSVRAEDLAMPPSRLRRAVAVVQGLSLPRELMDTMIRTATATLSTPAAALRAAMPPGARARLTTQIVVQREDADVLSAEESEALKALLERGGTISATSVTRVMTPATRNRLLETGHIALRYTLGKERSPLPKAVKVADEAAAMEFLAKQAKMKPAQAAVLDSLIRTPGGWIEVQELKLTTGCSEETLKKLLDARLIVEVKREARLRSRTPPLALTPQQESACAPILRSIEAMKFEEFLLFGVTGSGKTEVYMRAIEATLAGGRQALFLVPEISLGAQIVAELRGRFGKSVALLHSRLTARERLANWRRLRSGESPIAVGARSASMAPLTNIGVVILDEEHDAGYKQESGLRYHARDVLRERAAAHGATLILGSATPSVETFYSADSERSIELLRMTQRATYESLPEVTVIDLKKTFEQGKPSILTNELQEALGECIERKDQCLLFINRRAFASALLCRECGHVPKCNSCSISLTYHLSTKSLRCHHCGHRERAPDVCPKCEGRRIRPLGLGTERVEAVVKEAFPSARVARLDRDIASRPDGAESVLMKLQSGEIDVLVGTQMIAKGLDFPGVSLVGVVAADVGLSIPDYRANERTFQLITQVSGRAGRHKPGKVIVQTFQPEHPSVRFGAAHDYEGFYQEEIRDREDAEYPPFRRIVRYVASGEKREEAQALIRDVAADLSQRTGIEVVGPAEAPIARLHGKWRFHLLAKLMPSEDVSICAVPPARFSQKGAGLTVDVDPGSLL